MYRTIILMILVPLSLLLWSQDVFSQRIQSCVGVDSETGVCVCPNDGQKYWGVFAPSFLPNRGELEAVYTSAEEACENYPQEWLDAGHGPGWQPHETHIGIHEDGAQCSFCLLYTSPSPRDQRGSRMPSSA